MELKTSSVTNTLQMKFLRNLKKDVFIEWEIEQEIW